MILKGSVHTLQETFFVCILETSRLMLFRDIIAFYSEYRMKRRHSLCKTEHFVRVHTAVAKCSRELTHVRFYPSVSASAQNSAPPTQQISVKFHIWAFALTFIDTFGFWLNWTKSVYPLNRRTLIMILYRDPFV